MSRFSSLLGNWEIDKVFEYLDQASDEAMGTLFLKNHPGWDEVRDDPRFQRILEKLGF